MLHENENDADGILQILKSLYAYVPSLWVWKQKICGEQGLVGDQLSVECGINGHMSFANGFSPDDRPDGLHFEIAAGMLETSFLRYSFSTCNFSQSLLCMTKLFPLKLLW